MRTESGSTPLGPLLVVVFESILEVFLVCSAGYLLARQGILDKKTQKQLNRVNVSVFTPALLFSKVAFFLSPAKLRELWIIPFFFCITTGVSMAVAYILGTMFRLKRSQRSFAIAAAMFMNSNSLPIALMQSLVITVPGLKWEKNDDRNSMVGRALTYLVLHSTLGMVLRWSYGVRLLAQADTETLPENTSTGQVNPSSPLLDRSETAFPPPPEEEDIHRHQYQPTGASDFPPADSSDYFGPIPPRPEYNGPPIFVTSPTTGRTTRPSATRKSTGVFHSFPNSPTMMATDLPTIPSTDISSDEDEGDDEFPAPGRRQITLPSSSRWQTLWRRTKRKVRNFFITFNDFMTAPLWAALASLIVALIQPLQHTLDMHIPPIKNALNQAGQCSIPVTLVVLGAYFYTPPDPDAKKDNVYANGDDEHEPLNSNGNANGRKNRLSQISLVGSVKDMLSLKSFRSSSRLRQGSLGAAANQEAHPGETKTVFVAVISRMVITPLLLLPAIALSAKTDWHKVFEDPVFVVSNVLLIASPPALTLAQITQAASGDAFERLISKTIFWSYCVVTPPSTIIFVVIGLLLAKL